MMANMNRIVYLQKKQTQVKDIFKLLKQSIFKINYHLIKSDEDTARMLKYPSTVQIKRLE